MYTGIRVGKERAKVCACYDRGRMLCKATSVFGPHAIEHRTDPNINREETDDELNPPPVMWPGRERHKRLPKASGTSGEASQREEEEESYRPAGGALAGFPGI